MDQQWIWQHPQWPEFTWDMRVLSPALSGARLAQGKVIGMGRMLESTLSTEAVAAILVQEGLTTSAIEGERLDQDSVRSSVAKRLGLPTAGLPTPPRDVEGLVDVLLDATRNFEVPLSRERLETWHAALFPTGYSGLLPIQAGRLRGEGPMQVVSGRPGHERVHFQAPGRRELDQELERFLEWCNTPVEGLDGLLRAGIVHLWFVTLHPFEDGNGRLARALTDMALAQDERRAERLFSLSAQILKVRESYYEVLEKTQSTPSMDITGWLEWFLEQVAAACSAAESTVSLTLAKARFWLRFRDADLNDRQRKVLNRLLDAGPGGFQGGMSTRKMASLTGASKPTATRDLADLVQKGCLVPNDKGGRSAAYEIAWEAS
ncbi:MAG TPA: Fic family protein [Holophaga sp.]|nr:Fic family protein [Holophaga sp.]